MFSGYVGSIIFVTWYLSLLVIIFCYTHLACSLFNKFIVYPFWIITSVFFICYLVFFITGHYLSLHTSCFLFWIYFLLFFDFFFYFFVILVVGRVAVGSAVCFVGLDVGFVDEFVVGLAVGTTVGAFDGTQQKKLFSLVLKVKKRAAPYFQVLTGALHTVYQENSVFF